MKYGWISTCVWVLCLNPLLTVSLCSAQDSEDEDEYYAMKRSHLEEGDAESQL